MSLSFENLLVIVGSYLLGSIPCGLIMARIMGLGDIRTKGSGNIGATNAFRVGGKKLGAITLLLDFLKGFAAVRLASIYGPQGSEFYAAFFAVFGHIFSIWLWFKGGKGVATTFAVIATLDVKFGLLMLGVWTAVFGISRISSLSSIITVIVTSAIATFANNPDFTKLTIVLGVLILFKHKDNILRLIKGQEGKI